MRTSRVAIVLVVALLIGAWVYAKATSGGETTQSFGDGLRTFRAEASDKVRLSPDGQRVAIVNDGELSVIRVRDGAVLTRAGQNIVDASWMLDGERVLAVEGPIPTGEIVTVGTTGRATGRARLTPSAAFGDGDGLAVDRDGARAAAIVVTRDAIGGTRHRDLATIDLATGALRVYATPSVDERNPVFLNDGVVALNANGHLQFVDLQTGAIEDEGQIAGGPYASAPDGEVVVNTRAEMFRVDAAGARTSWFTLGRGRVPVAFQPNLTRAVFRDGARLTVEATIPPS